MVGLFQADLPFGRRFWCLLIVVALFSLVYPSVLTSVPADPIHFALESLLMFGFAIGTTFFVFIALLVPYYQWVQPRRLRKKYSTRADTLYRYIRERHYYRGLGPQLALNGTFIVAVLIALIFYQAPFVRFGGAIGLALVLTVDIFSREDKAASGDDVLKLTWLADGMHFCLRFPEQVVEEEFDFVAYLEDVLFDLACAGWRRIDLLDPSPKLQMLLFVREHDNEGVIGIIAYPPKSQNAKP